MAIRVWRLFGHYLALILLLVGILAPAGVLAQQPIIPLQYSFSDPGARSMGFGGAFIALSDDATAAFSNPAGLVQLLDPEVSIEVRRWSYSTPYTEGGRLEGLPSGLGIDTTVGLRMATSEYDTTGISFISLAYPLGKWSLALFRHEFANLEFLSETQGLFSGGTECCQRRQFDQRAMSDMKFVSHGLSAAYRINDKLDLGLGVGKYDTSLKSTAMLFLPDDDSTQKILGMNSYLPERSLLGHRTFSDDSDWAMTGGILWHLSETWSIGGVYREGPEIKIAAEIIAGEAVDFGVPPGAVLFRNSEVSLELPGVYGLGFAYRAPDRRLTVSFQWDHFDYSSIPESLKLEDQTIDDANELHLGAEYVFTDSTPIIAVRLGVWLEPDHQMRATSDDVLLRALLPRGKSEMHYTAGLGVAMQRFQVDLGVDFGDRSDTVSLSVIYSF